MLGHAKLVLEGCPSRHSRALEALTQGHSPSTFDHGIQPRERYPGFPLTVLGRSAFYSQKSVFILDSVMGQSFCQAKKYDRTPKISTRTSSHVGAEHGSPTEGRT